MTGDVPAEVYAALREAQMSYPVGPVADGPDARAAWWEQHARVDEAERQAAEQLHGWAVATEQPAAVITVIGIAAELLAAQVRRCRGEAARAKEDR